MQEKPELGQESPSLPWVQPRGSQAQAANKQSLGRNLSPAFWGGFYRTRVTRTRAADVTIYHFISKGINIAQHPEYGCANAASRTRSSNLSGPAVCMDSAVYPQPTHPQHSLSVPGVFTTWGHGECLARCGSAGRTAGQAGAQHPAITPLPNTSPYLDAGCPLAQAGSDRTLLHPGHLPQLSAHPQSQPGALHCR